jgi:hypothetical protein
MKATSPQTAEVKTITITVEQAESIRGILGAIQELAVISPDDCPTEIMEILAEKGVPLAEELFQLIRQSKQ